MQQGRLSEEGRPRQAISRFRRAEPPNPYFVNWWTRPDYALPIARDGLVRAFEAVGDTDSAIDEYEQLTKFDGDSRERHLIEPMYHYRLSLPCEKIGRYGAATKGFARFIELWKDADAGHGSHVENARAAIVSTREKVAF